MKRSIRTVWAAGAAVALVSMAAIGSARAYFTTYATARGGHEITLAPVTEVTERFADWTKHISLRNTGDTECYVRVRAFAGSAYGLEYDGSDKWSQGTDGYWYYDEILPAGGQTEVLDLEIKLPVVKDEFGNQLAYTEDFNVVVIQECTAVLYREDGTAYADWEDVLESGEDHYEWEEGDEEHEGQ